MKIVFFSHYRLPHVEGIEAAFAVGVPDRVARRGHAVHVPSNEQEGRRPNIDTLIDRPMPCRSGLRRTCGINVRRARAQAAAGSSPQGGKRARVGLAALPLQATVDAPRRFGVTERFRRLERA